MVISLHWRKIQLTRCYTLEWSLLKGAALRVRETPIFTRSLMHVYRMLSASQKLCEGPGKDMVLVLWESILLRNQNTQWQACCSKGSKHTGGKSTPSQRVRASSPNANRDPTVWTTILISICPLALDSQSLQKFLSSVLPFVHAPPLSVMSSFSLLDLYLDNSCLSVRSSLRSVHPSQKYESLPFTFSFPFNPSPSPENSRVITLAVGYCNFSISNEINMQCWSSCSF